MSNTTTINYGYPFTASASGVYAELLALAMPVVTIHTGDLFHDAIWLNDRLTEASEEERHDLTFYYGVRDAGTSIGCDLDMVRYIEANAVYRIDVEHSHDRNTVTVSDIT